MIDTEALRKLPKVELHCHLEGSLRAETLVELAATHGIPLPSTDPAVLYRFTDLTDFLATYELACRAVVTSADFARVTYESLEDAAVGSTVVHREMFFNPSLHPGVDYVAMLTGIVDGCRAAAEDFGISCRLIPSIYRQMPPAAAVELVELIAEHRTDEVIGIGMDGDELADPPERFVEAYAAAGEAGLHRTAHVAHDGPASFITTCLDELGCERVDHGYHVVDDAQMMASLADRGVPFLCATPTPPLCGWPSTFDDSPIRTMIEGDLTVVLNSDDPTMLGTDLATEFDRVGNGWGLEPERVRRLATDSIEASWLDDVEKAELRMRVEPEIDELLGIGDHVALPSSG